MQCKNSSFSVSKKKEFIVVGLKSICILWTFINLFLIKSKVFFVSSTRFYIFQHIKPFAIQWAERELKTKKNDVEMCGGYFYINVIFRGFWKFDNGLCRVEGNEGVYWKIELMSIKNDPREFRIFFLVFHSHIKCVFTPKSLNHGHLSLPNNDSYLIETFSIFANFHDSIFSAHDRLNK